MTVTRDVVVKFHFVSGIKLKVRLFLFREEGERKNGTRTLGPGADKVYPSFEDGNPNNHKFSHAYKYRSNCRSPCSVFPAIHYSNIPQSHHSLRSIGMSTSFVFATSIAVSYPASAWRATPSPGSYVNTLFNLRAAESVPSATTTMPA